MGRRESRGWVTNHQNGRELTGTEKGTVAWGRGDGSGLEWKGIDFVVRGEVEMGSWRRRREEVGGGGDGKGEEDDGWGGGLGPFGCFEFGPLR